MKSFPCSKFRPFQPIRLLPFARGVLFALVAAFVSASLIPAQTEQAPDATANLRPGFLEIARDPDADAEQKRTVAAMMEFVKETDPAKAFEKLKATDVLTLYGGGEDGLSDLSPLSGLSALKTLVLFNHRISDLKPLETLENLRTLRLEVNRIRDITPLGKLRKLQSLQITDNQISDLRPLAELTQLETLWLSNNQITDITPLRGLKELRDLHLTGNKVTDLRIFSELAVSDLRLGGNGITDISALREMNQNTLGFIALDLSNNAIRDVTPLAKLGRVTSLNLANNRIPNVDALDNPELNWLDLEGNQLTKVPDLRKLAGLAHINLKRNPIADYADLAAMKKDRPRLDIAADEAFTRAFEGSIPAKKELEGSPLLGEWRSDPIESEWGPMVLELRFKANGMVYQGMLSADAEDEGKFSADGKFSVRGDRLVMTIMEDTSERRFAVKDDVLTLEEEGEKIRYKKVKK